MEVDGIQLAGDLRRFEPPTGPDGAKPTTASSSVTTSVT